MGILAGSNGIVLAAERKTVSKLLAPSKTSEKTYKLDDATSCVVAGLTADANILINEVIMFNVRFVQLVHTADTKSVPGDAQMP